MKISIIIPIYNSGKFLNKCINSIINQSYKDIELVLVNDGSTDSSDLICKKFKDVDDRIIYLQKNNGGPSSARNLGLQYVTGDLLMFVDSDDYLETDALKYLNECFEDEQIDLCVFSLRQICEDVKIPNASYINIDKTISLDEYIYNLILETPTYGSGYIANKIFRVKPVVEYFDKIPLFSENFRVCEDKIFYYKILRAFNKIKLTSKICYNYVPRSNSVARADSELTISSMIKSNVVIYDFFKDYGFMNHKLKKAFSNKMVHYCYFYYSRFKKKIPIKLKYISFLSLTFKNKVKAILLFF